MTVVAVMMINDTVHLLTAAQRPLQAGHSGDLLGTPACLGTQEVVSLSGSGSGKFCVFPRSRIGPRSELGQANSCILSVLKLFPQLCLGAAGWAVLARLLMTAVKSSIGIGPLGW